MAVCGLALACSTRAPVISSVKPTEIHPGSTLTILGSGFDGSAAVSLLTERGDVIVLQQLSAEGQVVLEGQIPESVAPGSYDVQVDVAGEVAVFVAAVTVQAALAEVPCSDRYTANTQLSLATGVVVVDRFYADGRRETVRTPLVDLKRVEYELIRQDTDTFCSAIYLRRRDGGRVLFADDSDVDLKQRAYRLARDMGISADVVREDARDSQDG